MKKKQLLLSIFLFVFVAGIVAQKNGTTVSKSSLFETNRALSRLSAFKDLINNNNEEPVRKTTVQQRIPSLKLDSVIRRDSNDHRAKDVFEYNAYGNQTRTQSYYWDGDGWMPADKTETVYDQSQYVTQALSATYRLVTQTWVNVSKIEYTYDGQHNVLTDVSSVWDTDSSKWIVKYRHEKVYDDNNHLITELSYSWAANTKNLVLNSKSAYTYTNNGQKSDMILYKWNAETKNWNRVGTKMYTYDEQANMISTTTLLGETDAMTGSSYKTEIIYNQANQPTMDKSFYWDTLLLAWVQSYQTEYSYDDSGRLLKESTYLRDKAQAKWIAEVETNYMVDSNGNKTSKIVRKWNETSQEWQNMTKISCSFDQQHADELLIKSSHVMTSIFGGASANIPLEGMQYDWNQEANQWNTKFTLHEQRYYSEISLSGLDKTATTKLKVYPNPVTDKLVIESVTAHPALTLYNLQGAELLQSHANELDLSQYPSGIYLLDVNGQRVKVVKK